MIITIISRDVKLTEGMELVLKDRLDFLQKFLKKETKVDVKVTVEKNTHAIEVLFSYNNQLIKLEEKSDNFYSTVDLLADKLKNHMGKLHDLKIEQNKSKEIYSFGYNSKEDKPVEDVKTGKIVKRKSFSMKPMSEDEAILQMNLLGHTSFMFCNADLDFLICLLYKRKDGNYGIIESFFDEEDDY